MAQVLEETPVETINFGNEMLIPNQAPESAMSRSRQKTDNWDITSLERLLNAKPNKELRSVATTNPALVHEWLGELQTYRDRSEADSVRAQTLIKRIAGAQLDETTGKRVQLPVAATISGAAMSVIVES